MTVIVIVTHNSRSHLPELFASLEQHGDLAGTTILCVDNGSVDGTVAELERRAHKHPRLEFLPQANNRGFAGGCNVGLARARALGADYVMLLNPDTVVTAGWLDALTSVMDAHPEIAAAQPLLLLHDEPHLINSGGNQLHFCGFGHCGSYRETAPPVAEDAEPFYRVPYASGAALLLRMAALDESGDFDELLFLYHEDCDLQIRLRQRGYECVVVGSARVLHKYDSHFSAAKYGWLERNRWMVLIKDWPLDVLLAAAPVLVGVEAAVLLFAARSGWWPELVSAYRDVALSLPALLSARAQVQSSRTAAANEVLWLSGAIHFDSLDHWLIRRVANPALSLYWRATRRFLPSVRAARAGDAVTAARRSSPALRSARSAPRRDDRPRIQE